MNIETYKKIAQWVHPDGKIVTQLCPATLVTDVIIHGGEYECSIIFNHHEADQRLHLQDMYLAHLQSEQGAGWGLSIGRAHKFIQACKSAEALLEAIEMDIL